MLWILGADASQLCPSLGIVSSHREWPLPDYAPSQSVDHSQQMADVKIQPGPLVKQLWRAILLSGAGETERSCQELQYHLKQQAKRAKAKLSVTCCRGIISKRQKPEKVLTHTGLFSHERVSWLRVRWISADVGILPLLREPWTKRSGSFMDSGLWVGKLGLGKYWVLGETGESIMSFSPLGGLSRETRREPWLKASDEEEAFIKKLCFWKLMKS